MACTSVSRTEMPDQAQCPVLSGATRYSGLTLGPNADGIAFATRTTDAMGVASTVRLGSLGAPCSRATDRDACLKTVDMLLNAPSSEGWMVNTNPVCRECGELTTDLGVITNGNQVFLARLTDVLRVAAPIETSNEAATALYLQGRAADCGENNVRRDPDGWTFRYTSRSCSGEEWELFYKVSTTTGVATDAGRRQLSAADNGCVEGRRPSNLAATGVPWLSSLSACFSEIAHMEAAAVLAFDELVVALEHVGAPVDLIARARRARQDEVEHARATAALARKYGGAPSAPHVDGAASSMRPLMKLAYDNAVEGCVREAYGALVAAHQAARASDPEVRAAFHKIAMEEAEHAELSFALDEWLCAQLTVEERREIDRVRSSAWSELEAACSVEPSAEVREVAGMPSAREARALLALLAGAALAAA